MSVYTCLNYQRPSCHDAYEFTKLCLCCLAKDVTFVNLSNCEHYGVLEKLCSVKIPKMELGSLVCYHCHAKLKTICDFKIQAEESFTKLWNRHFALSKRAPKLEEVQLVNEEINLVYQPDDLMEGTAVKPEQHYVTDYQEVLSGCRLSVPQAVTATLTDLRNEVPNPRIMKEDDKFTEIYVEPGGMRSRFSKTQTEVTNYPEEEPGLYPDCPQDYEALLEQDEEPLVKIERKVEIEVPEENTEAAGSGRKTVANKYSKSNRKKEKVNDQQGLFCSKCDMTFSNKRHQKQHNLILHRQRKPPKVAKKRVSSVPETERPSKNAKRFTIENCGEMAKLIILTYEELMLEREKERNRDTYLQKLYKCDSCIVHFKSEQNLREHNAKKHQLMGSTFQCDICKTVLTTNDSLKEHEKRHYKRFECMACQKRYNSLLALIDHFNKLHEPKNKITFSCNLCDFTTSTDRSYKYHKEKFHPVEKFFCIKCTTNFVTKGALKSHILHVHDTKREKFPCQECNMTYYSESYLAFHIKTVHRPPSLRDDDDPATAADSAGFFCDTCNKYFKGKTVTYHLKNHKNHRRDEDKRFMCDICSERFFIKSELKYHIIWKHLKLKEFVCPHCDKGFGSTNNLNKHINYVHKKLRPPRDKICDYCGKGFQTNVNLQSHIRSHTGERPYQCAQCPATFAHSGALYTHNKLLHKYPRKRKL